MHSPFLAVKFDYVSSCTGARGALVCRSTRRAESAQVNRGTRFWMEVNHDLKMWLYGAVVP